MLGVAYDLSRKTLFHHVLGGGRGESRINA